MVFCWKQQKKKKKKKKWKVLIFFRELILDEFLFKNKEVNLLLIFLKLNNQ